MIPDLLGALCAEVGMPENVDGARFICKSCPVRAECKEWALGDGFEATKNAPMLGGLTSAERRTVKASERGYEERLCPVCDKPSPESTRNRAFLHPECYLTWRKWRAERGPMCVVCKGPIPSGKGKCDECKAFTKRMSSYRERVKRSPYTATVPGTCSVCGRFIPLNRRKCDDCRKLDKAPMPDYRITPDFLDYLNET